MHLLGIFLVIVLYGYLFIAGIKYAKANPDDRVKKYMAKRGINI